MRSSVQKHRIRVATARRPHAGLRHAVTLLALIAFVCQSYLIQTHIHGLPQSVVAMSDGKQYASPLSQNDKSPTDSDQANCPLCQDSLRAGSYVLPPVIAALPPTLVVSAILMAVVPSLTTKSVSHIWQGRGPPRA